MHSVRFQLLACDVALETDCAAFHQRLLDHAVYPEQNYPVSRRLSYTVRRAGDGYRITGDDGDCGTEADASATLRALFTRINERVHESFPNHIAIHAASGLDEGEAYLFVGEARAGKTTLALALLLQGFAISGDEMVLLDQGRGIAFPRRLYMRDTSLGVMPELKARTESLNWFRSPENDRMVALDPGRLERAWRIAPARIGTIFALEPNHGNESFIEPCPKIEMVRRVVGQCAPPDSGGAGWMDDLCRTIDQARTYILHNGTLETAIPAIRRALAT